MKAIYKNKTIRIFSLGIILTSMVSLGIFIQGCSDKFDTEVNVEDLNIPEEYNEVGKLHNEGLEYIYNKIKTQSIEYAKNPRLKSRPLMENKDEFIKQATLDFCKQNKKLQQNIDICEYTLKDNVSLKSSGTEVSNPAVQQLLDEAMAVLRQKFKKDKLSQLKAQLDMINQKAAETLSESDASIVYCATSTGYSSYQYWMKNYRKWYFALHYPQILERYSNEELNQLQLKNGTIRTKWMDWDKWWDTAESWWEDTCDAVEDWWDEYGDEVLLSDLLSAGYGAGHTLVTSGAASLVFGPSGVVVNVVAGGVTAGVSGSALSAVGSAIIDSTTDCY